MKGPVDEFTFGTFLLSCPGVDAKMSLIQRSTVIRQGEDLLSTRAPIADGSAAVMKAVIVNVLEYMAIWAFRDDLLFPAIGLEGRRARRTRPAGGVASRLRSKRLNHFFETAGREGF